MLPHITLPTARGFLRPIALGDLHQGYVDGLNDPEVNRFLEVRLERQTSETVANFVVSNIQSSDAVLFGIYVHDKLSHIGTVRLHNIHHSPGQCYIGICIFDKLFWGSGIGSDIIKAVSHWAFEALNLCCIEAHAYLDNIGSIRAFEKAGYQRAPDVYKSLPYELAPLRHAVLVAERTNF